MPLVRIDLREGKPEAYRRAISQVVYDAMLATIGIPADDRFQIINEHSETNFVFAPDYLQIHRTADLIVIQIFLNEGRALDQKKALYRAIADGLAQQVKLRREDVLITLVEVKKENWSFGNGIAQYV